MLSRYQRIARSLRERITGGDLPPGSRLPTEKQLAAEWSVSIPTIRQAVDELQGEGLIEKRQGIGTFVRAPRARITYTGGQLGLGPLSHAVSLHTQAEETEVPADGPVSALLRVPAETLVTRYKYVSRHDGSPYVLAEVFVPQGAPGFSLPSDRLSPWGCDFRRWLTARGVHTDTVQRVSARPPTPDEADDLEITIRSFVLAVERTTTDEDGRVVEGARLVLPSDRADAVFTSRTPHISNDELEGAR